MPGFLCKITPAVRKVFMLQYRTNTGERRKPALGLFGELTVDQARLMAQDWLADLPVGYFGASTGAAAALSAAAAPDCPVQAVVSRGGRPDLAGGSLPEVRAPTLLIVSGSDDMVLDLNRSAQSQLTCENRLDVIPGATHLFEEPGTLDRVAQLASRWFVTHLRVPA